MDRDSKDRESLYLALGIYSAAGIQLAITVVGGLFLGNWCDRRFETTPWLTIVGLLLGATGGFMNFIRLLNWHRERREK